MKGIKFKRKWQISTIYCLVLSTTVVATPSEFPWWEFPWWELGYWIILIVRKHPWQFDSLNWNLKSFCLYYSFVFEDVVASFNISGIFMVHVFAYSPTKWNFAHNQLKFFKDLKNAMKNTCVCLEHFNGSLKTACTMPWKIHELQHEDTLGFSTSLKTLASTFNQYLKVFQW